MNIQVGVKALIQNSDGAFLFLQRSTQVSTDTQDTSWDIPGGRIDPSEALYDALRREIREETGSDIDIAAGPEPHLLAAQDIFVPAKDLHVIRITYMLPADLSHLTLSDEHLTHTWLTPDAFDTINTEPYLKEVLDGVRAHRPVL